MSGTGQIVTIAPADFDAVLFDLDGVLTPTAAVHASAWKKLFDDFLKRVAASTGTAFVRITHDTFTVNGREQGIAPIRLGLKG